nr:MAG TPA: zinc-ribbon domain protein [Caudoviricetes sp.]
MDNKLDCEDCKKVFFSKDKLDYDCVFQNGICSECLVKRVERGIEW